MIANYENIEGSFNRIELYVVLLIKVFAWLLNHLVVMDGRIII